MIRRRHAAALSLVTAAGLCLGTAPAHAADGPSFAFTWDTHGRVIHEYGIYTVTNHDAIVLTNDGTVPLTFAALTYSGTGAQGGVENNQCTTVQPGATCTLGLGSYAPAVDYPGPAHQNVQIAMTAPDGTSVTRSVSRDLTVVDDQPVPNSQFSPLWPATSGPIVCRRLNPPQRFRTPEPVQLVRLTSAQFGDLLDPANPRVVARGAVGSCPDGWQVAPSATPTGPDTITATFADDEGNKATSTVTLTYVRAVEAALVGQLTSTVADVPETGGPVPFTASLRNTGSVPLTVTTLRTPEGRDLLAEAAKTGSGTTCGPLTIAPGAESTCTFTAVLSGTPGRLAEQSVTVTATGTTSTGPVALERTVVGNVLVTDVPPSATLEVRGVTLKGATATVTAVLAGGTREPLRLVDAGVTGADVLASTCTLADGITAAKPYTCTVKVRLARGNAPTTLKLWAVVGDDEGGTARAEASHTISRR